MNSANPPANLLREVAGGDWPVRGDEDEARVREAADFLLAVARGKVVGVFTITGPPEITEAGRLRFDLAPPPAWLEPLVGLAPPEELKFRQGERWPVRIADTEEIRDQAEREPQRLDWRGFKLVVDADGDLNVQMPIGRQVRVTARR